MSISGKTDPVVRPIAAADIAEALGQGLRDFQAMPLLGLMFGGLYVAGGENFPEIAAAMEGARDRLVPGFNLRSGRIRGEGRADHAPFFEKGIHAVSLFAMGGDHHGYHYRQ